MVNYYVSSLLFAVAITASAHGIIEKPASREQFCGVESQPAEIFAKKMTHEECRPIMTNPDGSLNNSVYNFMAVLTHTTGRQGRTTDNLPKNVCGFDSETWGGGKTPWDSTINLPTNTITSGINKFIWNINWGNHFSDTEEFAYWITKPNFIFNPNKALSWSDFEDKPFCLLKYDDKNPSANPNIVPDKVNNKFITSCQVPARQNRAIIYAEWGRNYYTFERFHSCIDVVFSDTPPPTPTITAVIAPLPSRIQGPTEIILDGSQSKGDNLTYQWSVSANDPSFYVLSNADQAKAKLVIKNVVAEQQVAIDLTVKQGAFSEHASSTFLHLPAIEYNWQEIGVPRSDQTLTAGDKIYLRVIDKTGKDNYFPASPMVLDASSALAENWSYALAQAVNGKNPYSITIGVLDSLTGKITPIHSATANRVYAPNQSGFNNAYVIVIKKDVKPLPCWVEKKPGSSAYWLGYELYSSNEPILLDFTASKIDLNKVTIDAAVFTDVKKLSPYKLLINHKPDWVTQEHSGYIGFLANNYPALASEIVAACTAG